MTTRTLALAAAAALSAGLGASLSPPTAAADGQCSKWCREDYTACWYSCTPGQGWCYDLCRTTYYDCIANCPP